jgi:hypothetical protein
MAKLLSAVCRVAVDALLGFYERRLRKRAVPFSALAGESSNEHRFPKLQSGTVTVVQRTNSDFRLNPQVQRQHQAGTAGRASKLGDRR